MAKTFTVKATDDLLSKLRNLGLIYEVMEDPRAPEDVGCSREKGNAIVSITIVWKVIDSAKAYLVYLHGGVLIFRKDSVLSVVDTPLKDLLGLQAAA